MWASMVIELYETRDEHLCLLKRWQLFPWIDTFRLQYAVETLSNGIVCWLVIFGHRDCDTMAFQHVNVCVTTILYSTVGMVDNSCEIIASTYGYGLFYGHLQGLDADSCSQRVCQRPPDNHMGIGICYQMQVAHVAICQRYIGNVGHPAGWQL